MRRLNPEEIRSPKGMFSTGELQLNAHLPGGILPAL